MKQNENFLKFIAISTLWSLTFPMVKYVRLHGGTVWPVSLYQCISSTLIIFLTFKQKALFATIHKSDMFRLALLGFLRNFLGVSILNYLLLSQSITNVTIALLFIPFTTVILECLMNNFRPTKHQNIGILTSGACVILLTNQFNHVQHITWHYLPLTLLASIVFSFEAIILKNNTLCTEIVLFWQNLIGATLTFILMVIINHTNNDLLLFTLPSGMIYWVLMVSFISIFANHLFIRLTQCSGPTISTQINIMIVLLSLGYDALFFGSLFLWQNLFIMIVITIATQLLTNGIMSERHIKHHT